MWCPTVDRRLSAIIRLPVAKDRSFSQTPRKSHCWAGRSSHLSALIGSRFEARLQSNPQSRIRQWLSKHGQQRRREVLDLAGRRGRVVAHEVPTACIRAIQLMLGHSDIKQTQRT